ncbi:TPA: hypothetical protein QCU24_005397 [Bacillus cereus]|nr:hypothetical protein [Bacillus cereus]
MSAKNVKLVGGKLTLSPENAKQLLAELEQYKVTNGMGGNSLETKLQAF